MKFGEPDPKSRFSVYLDRPLKQKIKLAAFQNSRSVNAEIVHALTKLYEGKEQAVKKMEVSREKKPRRRRNWMGELARARPKPKVGESHWFPNDERVVGRVDQCPDGKSVMYYGNCVWVLSERGEPQSLWTLIELPPLVDQ